MVVFRLLLFSFLLLLYTALPAQSWQQLTPSGVSPGLKYGHSLVYINGLVYLYGGWTSQKSATNDIFVYDPVANSWDSVHVQNTPPPPRYQHKAVAYDGKMYIFFGYGDTGPLNDVWCFNPATGLWEDITPSQLNMPPSRAYHTATINDTTVYIFGGINNHYDDLFDLWAYYIPSGLWEEKQDIPCCGRSSHSAAIVGNQLYILSGYQDNNLLNTMWAYDIPTNVWNAISFTGPQPDARANHLAFAYKNYMLICGGTRSAPSKNIKTTNECWEFNTLDNTWVIKSSGPSLEESAGTALPSDSTSFIAFMYGGIRQETSQDESWFLSNLFLNTPSVSKIKPQIYPNPATDFVHIDIPSDANIRIYDRQGKLISNENLTAGKHTKQLTNLSRGLYFIEINTDERIKIPFIIMKENH